MYDAETCNDCKDLFLNPEHLKIFFPGDGDHKSLSYRRNIESLKVNAKLGCLVCFKLLHWFKLESDMWKGFQLGLSEDNHEDVVFAMDVVEISSHVLIIYVMAGDELQGELNYLALELLAAPDDPAARYELGRLANHDVGSEHSFSVAKQWMRNCDGNHPNCHVQNESILPTRVLDLCLDNDSKDIRLFINNGQSAPYACLSYCWGSGSQLIALTSSTLSAFIENIPLGILPQSIQDAIFTARNLGIRYLWIDSLCIIQDSSADKGREIKRMDQIYSNASVTISAASADNCTSGFLVKRDHWWSAADGPPIRLPYQCSDGLVGTISLVRYGRPARREPLHSRSWPLQEYLLSPRVLIYGLEQLFWVCSQGKFLKDGGQTSDPRIAELNDIRNLLIMQKSEPKPNYRSAWKALVEEYSPRKQSVPEDRIHALRGIASRFQKLVKDEYIAGFWKSWLLPHLLWRRTGETNYRCLKSYPSWSWLSIDSAVKMYDDQDTLGNIDRPYLAEVLAYEPTPVDESLDPFGPLTGAFLHVLGFLKKVENPDWEGMRLFPGDPTESETRFLYPQVARITLDAIEETASTSAPLSVIGPAWCLPIRLAEISDRKEDEFVGHVVQGILLVTDSAFKDFRRIGVFSSNIGHQEWFLAGKRQDFIIR